MTTVEKRMPWERALPRRQNWFDQIRVPSRMHPNSNTERTDGSGRQSDDPGSAKKPVQTPKDRGGPDGEEGEANT